MHATWDNGTQSCRGAACRGPGERLLLDIIELLKSAFLGLVEGITEWLPISSTGHMILVDEFIKLNVSKTFLNMFLVVIQLGAILEDILAPEQYETNVATVPNSRNVVEYAVKLPVEDGSFVWLPIDSKFPGDTYGALRDAYEEGSREQIDACVKQLIATLKSEAKDIHDKYLAPPHTTEFGIMFLPFEGLYAEAVSRGMVEILQRDYHVNLAGPSTMAALLNSLQMSFRTIAIQKRSGEVWSVLGAVKTEFDKFEACLTQTQNRLDQASRELDKLVGTRTRAIRRKLKGVTELSESETQKVLDIGTDSEEE